MPGTAGDPHRPRFALRASDSEREDAVARLRERFVAGQLSQDTFVGRMEAALDARNRGELFELFADLGVPRPRRPVAWAGPGPRLAVALAALREAVAGPTWRDRRPPGLVFPAGGRTRFTIGRDPDCDLVIPDASVSRWHAGLHRAPRGWLLTDLGSTNGTRLNGWRVRDAVPVRCGDRVSFGAVTFVLRDGPIGLPVT